MNINGYLVLGVLAAPILCGLLFAYLITRKPKQLHNPPGSIIPFDDFFVWYQVIMKKQSLSSWALGRHTSPYKLKKQIIELTARTGMLKHHPERLKGIRSIRKAFDTEFLNSMSRDELHEFLEISTWGMEIHDEYDIKRVRGLHETTEQTD